MRDVHYLTGGEPLIREITGAAFPDYTGRRYKLNVTDAGIDVRSFWDGGSRSYYVFVDLSTRETSREVPAQHPAFDKAIKGAERVTLPPGIVCVEHSYFQGRDAGITIHVHPRDLNASMLPARAGDLTPDEAIVLRFTASRKASYGGDPHFRINEAHRETGITAERWQTAREALIGRKLLDRKGAITPAGRNEVKR